MNGKNLQARLVELVNTEDRIVHDTLLSFRLARATTPTTRRVRYVAKRLRPQS